MPHTRDALLEYVVPLRWDEAEDTAGAVEMFARYLRTIHCAADITVIDGSDAAVFDRHAAQWSAVARHLRPGTWPGRNRKVAGVVTGVLAARHEYVVIADDDVRYRPEQLTAICLRLAGCDLVRPQNVFRPLPWHARWDTARSLLNRVALGDYPGTFALRRSTFTRIGGYDGDVLFENLQMMRTFRAAGATIRAAPDLYIARQPPSARRFLEQRVRQAYDDFAQPARWAVEASWLPLALLAAFRRPRWLAVGAMTAIAAAEAGRRRNGGVAVFPASSALWAPLWVAERAVCVWLATVARLRGGVRYRGERLRHAARGPYLRAAGGIPGAY